MAAPYPMPAGFKPWPPQEPLSSNRMVEFWWSDGKIASGFADKDWTEPPSGYRPWIDTSKQHPT